MKRSLRKKIRQRTKLLILGLTEFLSVLLVEENFAIFHREITLATHYRHSANGIADALRVADAVKYISNPVAARII